MLGYQFSSNSSIDAKNFFQNYTTVVICKCVKTDTLDRKFMWKYESLIRLKTTLKMKKVRVIVLSDFNIYHKIYVSGLYWQKHRQLC